MSTFASTREALHRVAEHVVSPARVAATGHEIALMVTPGGFGTPPFPDGGGVRVAGIELVVRDPAGTERRTSLRGLRRRRAGVAGRGGEALAFFRARRDGLVGIPDRLRTGERGR